MKIFTLLIMLALAFPAWAEELEHFPGWKINKIEQATEDDGSYSTGPDYFGLTPPDDRPAISIDARTAKLLKAGEAQPEEVYGRSARKASGADPTKSGDEQYVYSSGNNGFVQADTIASTLPGYQPETVMGRTRPERGGDSFGAGAVASYGGSGSSMAQGSDYGGGSYGAGEGYAPSSASQDSSSTGGGQVSNGLKAAAAAASPASAQAEANAAKARQAAAYQGRADGKNGVYAQNNLVNSGLNVGSGFDQVKSGTAGSTGGKNSRGTDGRALASDGDAPPPPCQKGRFVYDKPTYVRLKLPDGCGLIHISAWGAGGGVGLQTYRSGREGMETVREIPGNGGSFMSTSWEIDARKYDLVVVVGDPGGKAVQAVRRVESNTGGGRGGSQASTVTTFTGGDGGFPEGKDGGTAGGGGGGFSGVFLVAKSDGSKTLNRNRAMAVADGGSGGNGGAAGGSMTVPSTAPDARMTNQIGEKGKGTKAGFHYYPERGSAGTSGNSGKVILEYF
jgi:hypothetical protein